MNPIKVAIAGVGNCAASFVQAVLRSSRDDTGMGLITQTIGAYSAHSINFVAAFDVDRRKVGRRLDEAIVAPPNNSIPLIVESEPMGATVCMGPVLDGVAPHLAEYPEEVAISLAADTPVDVATILQSSGADVLVCYLPVGSRDAVRHYAEAAVSAGVAFVNCVPVFIANDLYFAKRFKDSNIPLIGDDIRSQVGATIVHQRLMELLSERGYTVATSYQLNVGGNADFLNMLDRTRLTDKKRSKTEAVVSKIGSPIDLNSIHIGPSDYVPHLGDTKIAFIRIEALGLGGAPLLLDLRLEVQDSPNSAAVAIDLVRYAAVARDLGLGGVIDAACSYYMKSPPRRMADGEALEHLRRLSNSIV